MRDERTIGRPKNRTTTALMVMLNAGAPLLMGQLGRELNANPTLGPKPPNIVLIVADDLGVDMVGAYGGGPAAPCTPNIDALASSGLLFRNCWADPLCSPTRAQILTGRHGFRTGIGWQVQISTGLLLPVDEVTIAERLPAFFSSSAVGKWHLTQPENVLDPIEQGFGWYAGNLMNFRQDCEPSPPPADQSPCGYTNWDRNENGTVNRVTAYATSSITSDAIERVNEMPEPWFLYVAYNSIHDPWHVPPAELCSSDCGCFCAQNPQTDAEKARAMAEALDTEVGRLLAAVAVAAPDAYVIFVGDNGTPHPVILPPFDATQGKGSLFEGGVNVPLIVTGPDVAPGESHALVSAVDLFATILKLSGVNHTTGDDSLSFAHLLRGTPGPSRAFSFAEKFRPGGAKDYRAVRNRRWKLIRGDDRPDRFYDLETDPFEQVDLYPPSTTTQQQNFDELVGELRRLGRHLAICPGDVNRDGRVDAADFTNVLVHFGQTRLGPVGGDIDNSGATDIGDLGLVLAEFGVVCE